MYIEVALPLPGLQPLTYHAGESVNLDCGMRVIVPLGRRVVPGVVVKVNVTPLEKIRIRSIVKQIDETVMIPPNLIKLGEWIADYYRCSLGEVLHAMLPGNIKSAIKESWVLMEHRDANNQRGIAAVIISRLHGGPKDKKTLLKDLPRSAHAKLAVLEKEGIIERQIKIARTRKAVNDSDISCNLEEAKCLSSDQQKAFSCIMDAISQKKFSGVLLYGVTGSGKTEVYLQAISLVLQEGRGAIFLLPEIALTTQIQERVQARFGNQVAVLHSALSPKKRLEAWNRLLYGEATVAIGARSAVFAPVRNLGIIVVDEEYESSYKQEDSPRYHARDVAAVRARQENAVLLMGAATPALETYYNAENNKLQLLHLPQRIDNRNLPEIRLVDMTREFVQKKRFPVFSADLIEEMAIRLKRNEQIILFLNRRGFAPLVMCPSCTHVLMCHDCSTSLVYHMTEDRLQCHSCGRTYPARPACPKCGTACIKMVGSGTQRIEEELKQIFPDASIARLDQDQTKKRGVMEKTLAAFRNKEADVLVGTQMVAKGIDFQNVTLVGIISADTALYLPDFRAEERTFQLIVQVAGRAGRGGKPGLVIAQTQHIDNEVLKIAAWHNYKAFYDREIAVRKALGYPPYKRLANIVCRSAEEKSAMKAAELIVHEVGKIMEGADQLLGPVPSPYQRIAKESRYQVLIKSADHHSRGRYLDYIEKMIFPRDVKVIIDVDPVSLL